jgi:hypothetical protein
MQNNVNACPTPTISCRRRRCRRFRWDRDDEASTLAVLLLFVVDVVDVAVAAAADFMMMAVRTWWVKYQSGE